MDNASAYGAEDSRFESWRTQFLIFITNNLLNSNLCSIKSLLQIKYMKYLLHT